MGDLAASGLTPAQLALVMELSAAVATEARPAIDRAAENKRAYDREYRKAHPRADRTISYEHDDNGAAPCLDKETSPGPPKEIKPIPCVRAVRARLGYHRLPKGWRPSLPLPLQLQAKVDQWPPGTFDDEVADFKRWAANAEDKNGKGRKLDWNKALWNWLGRRHQEQHGRIIGRRNYERPDNPTAIAVQRVASGGY